MGRKDYPQVAVAGAVCMKCGGTPEIAINSEDSSDARMIIIACRKCAFEVVRALNLPHLTRLLIDYFEVAPPAACPNCGRKTETAVPRPEFEGQQCTHWTFKNGSLVVSPWREAPAPTKCAPCDRGWVIDPRGVLVQVPGL